MKSSAKSTTERQVQHLLLATILMLIPVYAFSMIENGGFASWLASPIAGGISLIYSITILAVWHKQKQKCFPEPPNPPCPAHKAAIIFAFLIASCWLIAMGATIGVTVAYLQSPDSGSTLAGSKILPAFEAASDLVQAVVFGFLGRRMVKLRAGVLSNPGVCPFLEIAGCGAYTKFRH